MPQSKIRNQKSKISKTLFLLSLLFASNSYALPRGISQKSDPNAQTVLKADQVEGDEINNTLVARGNVEVTRDHSVVYADQITYNKNDATIRAIGHVRVKNFEIGNMLAKDVEMKDDFSKGTFHDSRIFFSDGSYLFSQRAEREDEMTTTLYKSVFSICPNDEIKADNSKAGGLRDFASIKSSKMTIDRKDGKIRGKHSIFRIYNIPIFYTPYSSVTLPSKEKESGFLAPSYYRSTTLGMGFKTPYYWNIAPNMDLLVTPMIYPSSGQFLINNDLRHLASYGQYKASFEIANNKITNTTNTTVVNRTNSPYRWRALGKGEFDFTRNLTADFNVNTLSDRDYMRDYHMSYWSYSLSTANLNYMKGRDYHVVKTVRIQELEDLTTQKAAPLVLPSLDSHIESKPMFFKEKFALTSNITNIYRKDGLEYRRFTAIPEAKLPFNMRGSLFDLDAKLQNDFYWLQDNYRNTPQNYHYQSVENNYKPEISANWRLPLIKKAKNNTLVIEPMANLVWSSFKKGWSKLPNEDSNNSELTAINLFTTDRIYGFDRNESGQRTSYGVKSSLFNRFGEFGLTLGQSYRIKDRAQDVAIRGFSDNNRSNYIGQAMYKAKKNFSLTYSFQLNESNLRNDVNQLVSSFTGEKFSVSANYLLLRRSQQNSTKREQLGFVTTVKASDRWKVTLSGTKDLVTSRTVARGVTLLRDGCCTTFSFSVMESNPINFTRPQRTFSLLISFKNL